LQRRHRHSQRHSHLRPRPPPPPPPPPRWVEFKAMPNAPTHLHCREVHGTTVPAADIIGTGADRIGSRDSHAVHVDVRLRAAVQYSHVVLAGAFAQSSHPAFKHGHIRVGGPGRRHLLTNMVLLDRTQTPLGVCGEEVLPETRPLWRPLGFAGSEGVVLTVRTRCRPEAVVCPDGLVQTDRLAKGLGGGGGGREVGGRREGVDERAGVGDERECVGCRVSSICYRVSTICCRVPSISPPLAPSETWRQGMRSVRGWSRYRCTGGSPPTEQPLHSNLRRTTN
jgi:hypothetical protein